MDAADLPEPRPDDHGPTWSRHGAPAPLVTAAGIVVVEGIVAALYGVSVLAGLESKKVALDLTAGGFFLIVGVGLAFCAWALSRIRNWARGPVLLAQLMALGLAWNFRGGDTWGASVAFAVPAVIVLAGMLHPATIEALERGEHPGV